MTVGEYILKYINLNATTQVEIAFIAGIQKTTLNEVIKGKRRLSADVAAILQKHLKGFYAQKALYIQVDQELEQYNFSRAYNRKL